MATCDEIQTSRVRLAVHSMADPALLRMRSLAAILMGIAAFFVGLQPAAAGQALARPGDARSGALLLKSESRLRRGARGSASTSTSRCRGRPSARASRRSSATRPDDWVEAIYVYPLPEGGAVDTLKMVIGDRIVVGEIKERQEARIDLRAGASRTAARRR